jgi:cellulose synthase/poly-beta-1,6-N-acetylglucosamine synthase-like glycosyltransferase
MAVPCAPPLAMFSFCRDAWELGHGRAPTAFRIFFGYVWLLWSVKALAARRYRPSRRRVGDLATSVIVPVYNEPAAVFRRSLASVVENRPSEMIAVVDGGDPELAAIASEYCDRVLRLPRGGKRAAVAAGLRASDPSTEVVVVLDSDTIWRPGALHEMLRPFADPRVGGVTPRQAIFDAGANPVRRLADWMEDVRYHLTVPAQSVFGQIGCLAGRTIAYRREAFEPAIERAAAQTVLGIPQHVGDDRVLTNELLRNGWRTVYQSAMGPVEPARDPVEPVVAVAATCRVRLLRDRHRHAVRALRGARPGRCARHPRDQRRKRAATSRRTATGLSRDAREHRDPPGRAHPPGSA